MAEEGKRLSRREVLAIGGAAAVGVAVGCGPGGREPDGRDVRRPVRASSGEVTAPARTDGVPDDGALDEVLRRIHGDEPKSVLGLSTHAPMVAEALCVLGYADRAMSWLDAHDRPVLAIPTTARRIDPVRWRSALGPVRGASTWEASLVRWGDWVELFREELKEATWRVVLDRWVGRLVAGISAAATHGIIRTAHAVRALARRETPERLGELARGLAYWAAAYEELPAGAGAAAQTSYAAALSRVPLYQDDHPSAPAGNIVNGLRHSWKVARFGDVRDLAAPPGDLAAALSSLTATFARAYLHHGTRDHAIAFVHAVTAPCALRKIAPHIAPETARAALPYAWQAAAAIYSIYARRGPAPAIADPKLAPAELAARAVENGADHAIKFTEALLAENALSPDPVYLAAAEDAVARL
jgi:Questin oxidase-like